MRPTTLARLAATTLGLALLAPPAMAQSDTNADTVVEPAAKPAVEPAAEPAAEEPSAEATSETAPEPASEPAGDPAMAAAADFSDVDAATPIATIGGTEVTLGELIALRGDLPEEYQQLPDEVLMQGLTEQLVDQTILANAAREAGFADNAEVRLSLVNQERAVLADAYLSAEIEKRITPEALKAVFDQLYAEAEPVEEIRASHILVDSEDKATDLKKQLDDGAEFAKLAQDFSSDSTASRGGDLGWFAEGVMVKPFNDAAFALEAGTISEPVQSDFGWHLIKLEERRTRPTPEFAEVEAALAKQATEQARVQILSELREQASVEMPETLPPAAAVRADELLSK